MNIKPIGQRILVKPIEDKPNVSSLIFVPETVGKDAPTKGVVVEVGQGKFPVFINDTIIFSKYGGTEIKIDGIIHKILSIDDIIAKIIE